jgi:hypothetical protein
MSATESSMPFIRFMRSVPGRALEVGIGLCLIVYGSTHASLFGLVLMMAGMVPTVTGLTGGLTGEVVIRKRASRLPARRPREHGADR